MDGRGERIPEIDVCFIKQNLVNKRMDDRKKADDKKKWVLYKVDPIDEHCVQQRKDSDGKSSKFTTREGSEQLKAELDAPEVFYLADLIDDYCEQQLKDEIKSLPREASGTEG